MAEMVVRLLHCPKVHAVHPRGLYVLCDHTNCLKCSHTLTELILCTGMYVCTHLHCCVFVRTYGMWHSQVFIELPYECRFHSYGTLVPVLVEHLYQQTSQVCMLVQLKCIRMPVFVILAKSTESVEGANRLVCSCNNRPVTLAFPAFCTCLAVSFLSVHRA